MTKTKTKAEEAKAEKEGLERLAGAADERTLDEFMRRDPASISYEQRLDMIEVHRRERARFIKTERKREAKKEGVSDDE